MNKLSTAVLATACAAMLSLAPAFAQGNSGNAHGNSASAHGNSAHAKTVISHSTSSSRAHVTTHAHTMTTHTWSSTHSRTVSTMHGSNGTHGNSSTAHNCVNPAGHQRGWCKGNGTYSGRYGHRGATSISGTVTAVNGNLVTFTKDNGSVITVLDNNGTVLNVGQHYTLYGNMVNGQFVLGSGGTNPGTSNQTISGTIVAVGNGTVTLVGLPPITINVQQAINNGATNGALTVGRSITAYGYYSNNVFYATAIQ